MFFNAPQPCHTYRYIRHIIQINHDMKRQLLTWLIHPAVRRLDGFIVTVSDNVLPEGAEYDPSIVKGHKCATYSGIPPPIPTELKCTGEATGRYVYIHIAYTEKMAICEIEVYGTRMYDSYISKLVLYACFRVFHMYHYNYFVCKNVEHLLVHAYRKKLSSAPSLTGISFNPSMDK